MATKETETLYNRIMGSDIFRLSGPHIDLASAMIDLCAAIKSEPKDSDWVYLGEDNECSCADLIIGAYWSLTEWHGGQESLEYAALSALGTIFSPGMAEGPEPDSGEQTAYELIDHYFAALDHKII